MKTEALLRETEAAFPHMQKPQTLELSFHKVRCWECDYLREDLEEYPGPTLPDEAMGMLWTQLSCLSAKGFRWVLPSYLKYCIAGTGSHHDIATEFLVYHLSPDLEYQKDARRRLSSLNAAQLRCLEHFLEWCSENERYSDYFPDSIDQALGFVRSLMRHDRQEW